MIYSWVNIDNVIGKVIRNTRVSDTSYIGSMDEWIPEAMELLNTQPQHEPAYEDVNIIFHKGKLPCGLAWIDAVEWKGMRIPYGNTVKHVTTGRRDESSSIPPVFVSVPVDLHTNNSSVLHTSTLIDVMALTECTSEWYQTELGRILTSFEKGCVRIHYHRVMLDTNGLPLIPDNGDYKEALYWFVRKKMIESGYQDKVFSWAQCDANFEKHAERAIAAIEYPSPDKVHTTMNNSLHFLIPGSYWDNFFNVENRQYDF